MLTYKQINFISFPVEPVRVNNYSSQKKIIMPPIELIHLINQQLQRDLTPQQIGETVDLLYQLDYFYNAAQVFGREYLVMLVELKVIEIYVLRKNKPLIDGKYFYVLVQGKVDKCGYSTGGDISVERERTVSTLEDSIFLRIQLFSKTKKFQKIKLFEQQKLKQSSIINIRLNNDEQKLSLMTKLKQIQIFAKLSKADFNYFAYNSTLKNLLKGKISHQYNKPVQSLIYIIDGQIKMSLPFQIQEQNQNLDTYLDKYFVKHGPKVSKHQVCANYAKADWVGMEQHFDSILFKSFGVVMSVQAKLLYIPVEIFDHLFNTKANHAVFSKVRYLRQIKSQLLEKSSKVQQKKQNQHLRWSLQKNSLSPELKKKIIKYQLDYDPSQQDIKNPESQKDLWDKTQSNIPTKVVHIIKRQKIKDQEINQPKNSSDTLDQTKFTQSQRVNLFPQEYKQQFIYPNERRQIQQAEYKKKINLMLYLSPKHHRKACKNSKSSLKNPFNLQGQFTVEKSFFSMSKKVSQNFAMSSTFYRTYLSKGDQNLNLNFKTINSLEASRKDLMLRRKNQIQQEMNKKSRGSFVLPGLKSRLTIKDFQRMNSQKNGSTLDLNKHLAKYKSHIDSSNSFDLKSKQTYQVLQMQNSSSKISDIKQYSKTLFVNRQKLEKEMFRDNSKQSSMKKDKSLLSIQ